MYIFASDFDGTLNRNGVSDRDRDAVARFRAAGNLFGMVTGRDHNFTRTIRDCGVDVDFLLVFSGALCLTPDGDVIYDYRGPARDAVRGIVRYMGEHCGTPVDVCRGKSRDTFDWNCPDGDAARHFHPLCELDGYDEFSVLYAFCETEEETGECTAEIKKRYGDTVNPLHNRIYIDIPPAGMDKGVGLARYAALMNVPESNVWTAGDNLNDLAMISRFHGCAVENAHPDLKKAARGVYPDVAAMIDELLRLSD